MDGYLGQIFMFGGNFAPENFLYCDGALLPLSQYQALYSILGNVYGGNGQITFGLPDLKGRCPISSGQGRGLLSYALGEKGGYAQGTLTSTTMPSHNHAATLSASNKPSTSGTPQNLGSLGVTGSDKVYGPSLNSASLTPQSTTNIRVDFNSSSTTKSFDRMPMYAVIDSIICVNGIYTTKT